MDTKVQNKLDKNPVDQQDINPWKNISGVPKDGTKVDLWHKDGYRLTDMTPTRALTWAGHYWTGDRFLQIKDARGWEHYFTHYADIIQPDVTVIG